MKSRSPTPATTRGALVAKRNPTAYPTASITAIWITFVTTSASVRPVSTAARDIGSERNRSINPFRRSSARPSAVTKPPKTID